MTGERRRSTLHGRRKGHALKPRARGLMATLLPSLSVDLSQPAPEDIRDLFPGPVAKIWLEIGFGGGEHLVDQATRHRDIGLIGCEPFVNGMAAALRLIDDAGVESIRLHEGDAIDVLDWLPAGSIDRVYLLYPDPWPKRRHWKRRFVNAENLDRVQRVLAPGGEFRFASDIASYVGWTLAHCRAHGGFEWLARRADDWRQPWPEWPGTRYEAKSLKAGRVPTYLRFRRKACN